MRTNSVRVHARQLSTNSSRNSVELGVALDAHKFSKDSCGQLVDKFHCQKALHSILTIVALDKDKLSIVT